MNPVKPDPTYEGLLIQARALNRIVECVEAQLKHYRDKDYSLQEKRLDALERSLESEREMNAILTRELEEATSPSC